MVVGAAQGKGHRRGGASPTSRSDTLGVSQRQTGAVAKEEADGRGQAGHELHLLPARP